MDAADAETTRVKLRHALAGLEAGVLGASYMIVWLMLSSRLTGRSVWDIPNLFATTFYGQIAYQEQYFRSSLSGLALLVAICGIGGTLWDSSGATTGSRFSRSSEPSPVWPFTSSSSTWSGHMRIR